MSASGYFYREQRIVAGEYMDVLMYPIYTPPEAGGRRAKRKESSEVQKRLNRENARRKLVRLLHCNFKDGRDYVVHLTYKNMPTVEEAKKDIQRYIARLRYEADKLGKALKYIYVTEYGKKKNRIHHHVIVNGILSRDLYEKKWGGRGYANADRLQYDPETGLEALARYITKEEGLNNQIWKKYWCSSKNLDKPVVLPKRDYVITRKAVKEIVVDNDTKRVARLYPEYDTVSVEGSFNDVNGGYFVYCILKKRKSLNRRI